MQLPKPIHIIELYRKSILIPVTLEELYPTNIWQHAKTNNFLEDRKDIYKHLKNIPPDKSIIDYLKHDKVINDELMIYCVYSMRDSAKNDIAKYILGLPKSDIEDFFINK